MQPAEEWVLPPEKVMINIENYGNTTTATIPFASGNMKKNLKKEISLFLQLSAEALPGAPYTLNGLMIRIAG